MHHHGGSARGKKDNEIPLLTKEEQKREKYKAYEKLINNIFQELEESFQTVKPKKIISLIQEIIRNQEFSFSEKCSLLALKSTYGGGLSNLFISGKWQSYNLGMCLVKIYGARYSPNYIQLLIGLWQETSDQEEKHAFLSLLMSENNWKWHLGHFLISKNNSFSLCQYLILLEQMSKDLDILPLLSMQTKCNPEHFNLGMLVVKMKDPNTIKAYLNLLTKLYENLQEKEKKETFLTLLLQEATTMGGENTTKITLNECLAKYCCRQETTNQDNNHLMVQYLNLVISLRRDKIITDVKSLISVKFIAAFIQSNNTKDIFNLLRNNLVPNDLTYHQQFFYKKRKIAEYIRDLPEETQEQIQNKHRYLHSCLFNKNTSLGQLMWYQRWFTEPCLGEGSLKILNAAYQRMNEQYPFLSSRTETPVNNENDEREKETERDERKMIRK